MRTGLFQHLLRAYLSHRVSRAFALAAISSILLALAPGDALAAEPPARNVIDWSHDQVRETDANCGKYEFTGMQDHGAYTLWVHGTGQGTCTFHAVGLTFLYPTNYGPVTAGTKTLFAFQRFGKDVVVTWQPGY